MTAEEAPREAPALRAPGGDAAGEGAGHARAGVVEGLAALAEEAIGRPEQRAVPVEDGALAVDAPGDRPDHARPEVRDRLRAGLSVGDEQLGSLRGRGGARVGDEIGERDVDLVPDGAHHRHPARGHLPHQRLVVERRQVVRGAAAAAEDDGLHLRHPREQHERAAEPLGRVRALDGRAREEQAHRRAAERDLDDVVQGGAVGAGDDADHARLRGQRALALGREEALAREPLLQPLERLEQRPPPRGPRRVGRELELAPRRRRPVW